LFRDAKARSAGGKKPGAAIAGRRSPFGQISQ